MLKRIEENRETQREINRKRRREIGKERVIGREREGRERVQVRERERERERHREREKDNIAAIVEFPYSAQRCEKRRFPRFENLKVLILTENQDGGGFGMIDLLHCHSNLNRLF